MNLGLWFKRLFVSEETEAYDLLHTLKEEPTPQLVRMVRCGLHSGFRPCCIAFFIKIWIRVTAQYDPAREKYHKAAQEIMDAYFDFELGYGCADNLPGYVVCPACMLKRRFVKVQPCACSKTARARRVEPEQAVIHSWWATACHAVHS